MKHGRALLYTVALNGYATSYRAAIKSHEAYAARIGARYAKVVRPYAKDPALAAWLKIPLMLAGLENGYEWVGYIDADCVVRTRAGDFRSVLPASDADVYMAEGRTGRINSGVMFARSSESSVQYFNKVMESITRPVDEQDRQGLKYENGNVIHIDRTQQSVARMPLEWNNTYDTDLNDSIRHFAGPMRHLYQRSALDTLVGKAQKVFARRPTPQPERRSEDFLGDLQTMTRRAMQLYPAFKG